MKPGLAALPPEVWTDVLVFPWITRQKLAQIVDQIGDREFAEKLQFRLHDHGKQSLHYLYIKSKPYDQPKDTPETNQPQCQASLVVAHEGFQFLEFGEAILIPNIMGYEFPTTEMPENITRFKKLTIGFLDDQVIDFMGKIKPLFTNVFLDISPIQSAENLRILFNHLLPMQASIRGIHCANDGIQFLGRHFPDTLALAKEMKVTAGDPAFIPSYLDWLNSPQAFDQHGPRFLKMDAQHDTVVAFVNAVREAATTASTPFVILIDYTAPEPRWCWERRQLPPEHRAEEFNLSNAATNEQLTVRNGALLYMNRGAIDTLHYVEIVRHPVGANLREWIKQRAYYVKKYKHDYRERRPCDEVLEQLISLAGSIGIGHITKKVGTVYQEDKAATSTAKEH